MRNLVSETLDKYDEETLDDMLYANVYKPKNYTIKDVYDYDYSYDEEEETDLLDEMEL